MHEQRTPEPSLVEDSGVQPPHSHTELQPGQTAEGTGASHDSDHEVALLGTQLVVQFNILLKTARVHEVTNAAVTRVVETFLTTVKTVTQDHAVVLRVQSDFLYLNERHLKAEGQLLPVFMEFIDSLDSRGIGAISFSAAVEATDLCEFAYLFVAFDPDTSTLADFSEQLKEREVHGISIEEATSFTMKVGARNKQPKNLAKNLYLKTIGAIDEVMQSVNEGQAPDFKQSKRVIQNLIDVMLQDEPILLGLTTLRCYDRYTHNHSVNVSLLSLALGSHVGYPKEALAELGLAALFHDMGKSCIPYDILDKSEELTDLDWEKIGKHPVQGVINLARLRGIGGVPGRMAAAALEHHMNYDFSGYPKLTVPWEQSLTGRIVMIADCYDAMTSARVYQRKAMAPENALQAMLSKSGQAFDPILLKLFVNCIGILPIGSLALLDSNELAVVTRPCKNRHATERPWVRVVSDHQGNALKGFEVDLEETDADGHYKRSIVRLVDNTEYGFDTSQYFV